MYEIRILEAAIRDLRKLDPPIARRIAQRINWLAENLDDIQRERLTGDLSEFYKFRVGAYRILYEVIEDEAVIMIHQIGHRREIYR
jgi:mRNA interferase RelE/StbE